MSLALGQAIYHKGQKAQFLAGKFDLDSTWTGAAINGIRRNITFMVVSKKDNELMHNARKFGGMVATIALGFTLAPIEVAGRAAACFITSLLFVDAEKEPPRDVVAFATFDNPYLPQLKEQAKAMIVSAKIWTFFSNPILNIAYVIHNLRADSYRPNENRAETDIKETKFFEKFIGQESKLSEKNKLTKWIHEKIVTGAKKRGASSANLVAIQVFVGIANLATGIASSAVTLSAHIIIITGSSAAYGVTSLIFTQFQDKIAEFIKSQSDAAFGDIAYLGYMWNPIGPAILVIEAALDEFLPKMDNREVEVVKPQPKEALVLAKPTFTASQGAIGF
ncbi:MAG: hypothetical protein P0S95_07420 [Rhabdochlamydiaceae bacterium]|nr:hypothetical protein [Candidatus Amphrikana amoebophyrae]